MGLLGALVTTPKEIGARYGGILIYIRTRYHLPSQCETIFAPLPLRFPLIAHMVCRDQFDSGAPQGLHGSGSYLVIKHTYLYCIWSLSFSTGVPWVCLDQISLIYVIKSNLRFFSKLKNFFSILRQDGKLFWDHSNSRFRPSDS